MTSHSPSHIGSGLLPACSALFPWKFGKTVHVYVYLKTKFSTKLFLVVKGVQIPTHLQVLTIQQR